MWYWIFFSFWKSTSRLSWFLETIFERSKARTFDPSYGSMHAHPHWRLLCGQGSLLFRTQSWTNKKHWTTVLALFALIDSTKCLQVSFSIFIVKTVKARYLLTAGIWFYLRDLEQKFYTGLRMLMPYDTHIVQGIKM